MGESLVLTDGSEIAETHEESETLASIFVKVQGCNNFSEEGRRGKLYKIKKKWRL